MDDACCSICLEQYKSPVCLPCGHVHCEKCLKAHIRTGEDVFRSLCPTCRTPFSTTTPNLKYVPQKFHEFMLPSVRRIYIDIASHANLNAQIEQLENRVRELTQGQKDLMDRCERYMQSSRAHALRERESRKVAEKAQKDADDYRQRYDTLREQYDRLKTEIGRTNSKPPAPMPSQGLKRRRVSRSIVVTDESSSDLELPRRRVSFAVEPNSSLERTIVTSPKRSRPVPPTFRCPSRPAFRTEQAVGPSSQPAIAGSDRSLLFSRSVQGSSLRSTVPSFVCKRPRLSEPPPTFGEQ